MTANQIRLLYVGDVAVESSYHGSALLYRLLEDHYPEKLLILESSFHLAEPARRLPGVRYGTLDAGSRRWLDTRFHQYTSAAFLARAPQWSSQIPDLAADFQPEAVLTVAHGYSWLAAARYAASKGLPLHLIIHDDWPTFVSVPPLLRFWAHRTFARVYRQAASRLCVSPYMEERYRRDYGQAGTVLLPSRAKRTLAFREPPERLGRASPSLTGLFGGSLTALSYVRTLGTLARVMQPGNGRVLIYGPTPSSQGESIGVREPNLEWRGLVPHEEMIRLAREQADFLVVPMSFDAEHLKTMEVNFPSKLTDYTAIGLPLLVIGPPTTSAVRWALDNPGVAEVVTENSAEALSRAVTRLADPAHRMALAQAAIDTGARHFSHEAAMRVFNRQL